MSILLDMAMPCVIDLGMTFEKDGSGRVLGTKPLLTFIKEMEQRDKNKEEARRIFDLISNENREKIEEFVNEILKEG